MPPSRPPEFRRRAVELARQLLPGQGGSARRSSAVETYAVPGRVILTALTPLDVAAWTSTGELAVLDEDATDGDLGAALADMLERSLIAPRSAGDASEKALLKAAKARSYTALVRSARYIHVSRKGGGQVLLLPGAPGRSGGGWITVGPEDRIVVDEPSPEHMGAALRAAIERSTTTPVED